MSFHVPEKYRITNGIIGSDETYGNNGAFLILSRSNKNGFAEIRLELEELEKITEVARELVNQYPHDYAI